MTKAYFLDNTDKDPREPLNSGIPVYPKELDEIRVETFKLEGENDQDRLRLLDEYIKQGGYKHRDEVCLSPSTMENYEEAIKQFAIEHLHEDDEVRFIFEGSGYFDVRDKHDRWVRIIADKSTLITLPAGIYHRFVPDTNNYAKAVRVFKDNPKWDAIKRPEGDKSKFRAEYLKSINAL